MLAGAILAMGLLVLPGLPTSAVRSTVKKGSKLPDQTTQPMGNGSDGLCVPQARYQTAIHNLEDSSFGLYCGVASLIKNPSHVTVAFRRPVAVVHSRALII